MSAAALVGAGLTLAGCSAHQRQASAAPQPAETSTAAPASPATPPVAQPVVAAQAAPSTAKSGTVVASVAPASPAKIGKSGAGLASWYGDRFHGRPTANGERFDMAGLTAAHKAFPLPSYVRVTNVSNGRSVVVRVNDRGPYHAGRVIDVSKRAADILGFRGNGVGNVKLDFVGKAPAARDDSRLLASYQEFGRPALPPGVQMAALAPISDSQLAAEGSATAGAYAVASRAVRSSADYIVASAEAVGSGARSAAVASAEQARAVARKLMPAAPTVVAAAAPVQPAAAATASAYAPPQPLLAAMPPAIVAPKAKRVVEPQPPALASAAPVLRPSLSDSDVASRIASSFEGFGGGSTTVASGGSVSVETTR